MTQGSVFTVTRLDILLISVGAIPNQMNSEDTSQKDKQVPQGETTRRRSSLRRKEYQCWG